MDIRKYLQDCLLVIFLVSIHHGFCLFDDDYDEGITAIGRCPSIRNKLKNGRVRYRYKGRVAKFQCDSGYELAGKRSSTCVRGYWTNPVPVCVARGCNRVPTIANGRVVEMYRGALLIYDCNPGYTLAGDMSIHCDGRRWNASPPVCGVNPDILPDSTCDFEEPYLCGWTHDPTHDFDWKRNQFSTPSGHVGTGPSYDHTFGKNKAGYYLYIEASSPRKINDTARLFSPVFPAQQSGGCFLFWYHMYGATTGGLRVFFKPESHVFGELSPKWEKFGDQGNHWLRGNISVPSVNENFQIVIEGIRGDSYVGDSAIDDVQLTQHDCQAMENETTTQDTDANSCRGRCRTPYVEDACECQDSCIAALNCCSDYINLCTASSESPQQQTNEPEPGDYYGKTPTPLTLPATLSSTTSTEKQTSTATSNVTSQFTSQSSISSQESVIVGTTSVVTVTPEVHTSPSVSSMIPTTYSITPPVAAFTKLEPLTVTSKHIVGTESTSTSPSTTTPKPSTTVSEEILKTTDKTMTSSSTRSVKSSSSTKTTVMASTRSTVKKTTNAPKSSQSTNLIPTQSTTATTTTQSTTSTVRSTTRVPTSTTTTPKSTTQSSTTTTPLSTSQRSTTTTPMSTTERSTTTTPVYTTITSSTTPTTTTTMTTTTLKPIAVPVTQTNSPLSSVSTTVVFSSVTSSSTVPVTTTPRYNLRPRKSTTISTYSTATIYSSSANISTLNTTTSTSKTETTTIPSERSSTPQSRRWFNFTALRPTPTVSSTRISTTTVPVRTSAKVQYFTGSKYSYRLPRSTTTEDPSISDSYDMSNSKTESPKRNDSSSAIIIVSLLAIICIVGGGVFYIRRFRRKRQSKLDDDSELRFLPENDTMEYSDASVLDRILIK